MVETARPGSPMGRPVKWVGWALLVLGTILPSSVLAAADAGIDGSGVASAKLALQPLPELSKRTVPAPDSASQAQLKRWMSDLTSGDSERAFAAQRRIETIDSQLHPAVSQWLESLSRRANKPALRELLLEIRRQARARVREEMRAAGRKGEVITPDYLTMLLSHPGGNNGKLEQLIQVVACSRMLESMGTTAAARDLIGVYVRFGEFLRADTQLALKRLGGRSVAALIEATRHPAPKIAAWAEKLLRRRKRDNPSLAIAGLEPEQQADVLEAFGYTRNLEAMRLLLSYAASKNSEVRIAARAAIGKIGHAGLWPLRDGYERTLDRHAPRQWPWDRVAKELFRSFDEQRLRPVYALYEQGKAAWNAGELERAAQSFDALLTRAPSFEPQGELGQFYLQLGHSLAESERADATLALQRAARLLPAGAQRSEAESLLGTLRAEEWMESRHVIDQVALYRALERDENNTRAKELLDRHLPGRIAPEPGIRRFLPSLVIAAITVVALLIMWLRLCRAPSPPAESE